MVSLHVAEDRMAVYLEGSCDPANIEAAADALVEEAGTLGLAYPPAREDLIQRLRAAARPDGQLNGNVIAVVGQPAVPPEDGRIEWSGDYFNAGFVVDEATGAIDYRRRAAQVSVTAGQLLARVVPPREGVEGHDVFGRRIAVEKPRKVRLRPGTNVQSDELWTEFVATANGRVRLTGDVLSVDEVFTVSGSVGLATGHISHPGALIVEKDIEAGSEVVATGDIEVHGVIEGANVTTSGSLTVRGGIIGAPDKVLRIGGQVHAKFLRDAQIEAGGDVAIEKEVLHSIVKTRGAFLMPRGRVVGGETVALGGADLNQAGSDALVATVLAAGEDFRESTELKEKERRVAELEATLARIRTAVEAVAPQADQLPPARRQALEGLIAQARAIRTVLDELKLEIKALSAEVRGRSKTRVLIRGTLFPEVIFRLEGERLRVTDAYRGPVHAVLTGGMVAVLPAHSA